MAFRHISILADEIVRKAELAAQGHNIARKFGGGSPHREEGNEPPVTLYSGGLLERDGNELAGQDGDPTQPVARDVRQTVEPFGTASIASLPVGRDMMVVRNADPQGVGHEARPARVSATIISLAIWREVHSPAPASIPARKMRNITAAVIQSF